MSTEKLKEARITIGGIALTDAQSAAVRISIKNTKHSLATEREAAEHMPGIFQSYLSASIQVEKLILGDVGATS